jgi:Xaa-Pro aminopeptidase
MLSFLKSKPKQSPHSSGKFSLDSAEELEGFRKAQRLAYLCALETSKLMRPGWTEKQTAQLMDTFLKDHGVRAFFHTSFAWFGDRSSFTGFKSWLDFMPSDRVYREGDGVILDTAPILNGFTADIGYSFMQDPSAAWLRARELIRDLRKRIPNLFSVKNTSEIWKEIDEVIKNEGYRNCHKDYPFGVLGHKVHQTRSGSLPSLTIPFSLQAYWMLLKRGLLPELLRKDAVIDKQGIWAIEPHFGVDSFGVKFEELLVVDANGNASWLDEEVPHK